MRLVVVPGLIRAGPRGELFLPDVGRTVGDATASAEPLANFFGFGRAGGGDLAADGLEGRVKCVCAHAYSARLAGVAIGWRWAVRRHGDVVLDLFDSARAGAHEGHGGGEDDAAALAGLDGTGDEGFPVANALDVVEDRDVGVAREDEVAVHAVDGEVERDGGLRSAEALSDGSAAIDAAGAGRVPEGAGIGVDVGADVGEGEEGEDVLDRAVVGEGFGRFDQGRVFRHCGGCGV